MQQKLRFWLIFVILCYGLGQLPLWAAYLRDYPAKVTQPDGTILDCLVSGDEYYNWLHDENDYTIIQSPDTGWYVYAVQNGEELVAGSLVAGRENPATSGIKPGLNISQAENRRRQNEYLNVPLGRVAPSIGTINNLVVFIRFSDSPEFGQTFNNYSSWFNTGASSLKSYYQEVSYNQLTVNSTFYPSPVNGYVVSWQDSNPRSYYNNYSSLEERAALEFSLAENAIAGIASLVPQSLMLDDDNDGKVDNVVFVIQGDVSIINKIYWPHHWCIYDRNVALNGKRVYDYNIQIQSHLGGYNVGAICHEFFHSLGAPDLYHYSDDNRTPVGKWDLMATTTNPPQHMGAYMKWKYGDWLAAPQVVSGYGSYTLNPVTSQTGSFYRINSNISSTEYYIVEYRRKMGLFESSIPASGLLVYRIDTTVAEGNRDGPPDAVYIYRPNGTLDVEGLLESAFYSLESGRTAINGSTNPTPFLSYGANGGLSLFNIGSPGETISFYSGTPTQAQISWNPSSYSVNINANSSLTQALDISNLGDVTLSYQCSLPTNTITVLDEGFSSVNRPANWTEQQIDGTPLSWSFTTGGYNGHPPTAYEGTYNARLYIATSNQTSVTKLITPALDLTGAVSASLSFWHAQSDFYNLDTMKVYYKTSLGGAWNLLAEYDDNMTTWTQETIPLPNISGTYYIAFEGYANYGYGVCLDKVVVTKISSTTTPWASLDGQTVISGNLTGFGASKSIVVGLNSTGLATGTHNSTITIRSNSGLNGNLQIPIFLHVLAASPQIDVNPTSLAYGTALINTSQPQTFQITNTGTPTLSGNLTTPAGFTVVSARTEESALATDPMQRNADRNSLAYSVLGGATNTYTVNFNPTAIQAYSGNLTITHNAGGGNRYITLSGQGGKPVLGLSATTFSSSLAPGVSGNQTLTLSNSGNMLLSYTITIAGSPAWLRINNSLEVSNTIAVSGVSQNVTLNFNNSDLNPGTYNASIAGVSNDPANAGFTISVSMIVPGTLSLYNPTGGEIWEFGSIHLIAFSYTGTQSSVLFQYSTNGGSTWISQGSKPAVQGANSFNWTVPSTPSLNCKVRLVDDVSPYYQIRSKVLYIINSDPPSVPQSVILYRHPVVPGLVLSWEASTGYPSGYKIYFCSEPGGRFSLLSTVDASQTSYVDNSALSRGRGFYQVIAVRD